MTRADRNSRAGRGVTAVSGLKVGHRSKLLIAAFGLLVIVGCVPVGYYDNCAYGCYSGSGVIVQYDSYGGRPYYGRPYYGHRHWDRGRRYWR